MEKQLFKKLSIGFSVLVYRNFFSCTCYSLNWIDALLVVRGSKTQTIDNYYLTCITYVVHIKYFNIYIGITFVGKKKRFRENRCIDGSWNKKYVFCSYFTKIVVYIGIENT